ncbi:MAG: LamG domain-containing protein, partial [Bacteroidales bacterium]|nr:LamG domain-containing protein [Bacteroidales bacterium]
IKLYITSANTDIRHLTLKMDSTDMEEITQTTYINNLHPVYFNELQVTGPGWYDFNFTEPFEWNGFSNLLIEFSFENPEQGDDIILAGDETGWNSGITASGTNYAINLDGEMDFVDLPDDPYFNSDFTFEVWLNKKNNNKWSRVFDFGNGPNQSNVIITFCKSTSGNLSIHINNQSGSQSFETDEPLPLNEWTHIAVSLESHIGYLYINGVFSKYGMLQQPDNVTRTINYIGRSNWANDTFADGFVDEFRIYNYARSEEEINADYLMEIDDPQADPGLILYYQFDEGSGSHVTDHSLSGNHGTCYGLSTWYKIPGPETYLGFQQNNMRPQIVFERLTYSTMQELTDIVTDSLQNSLTQIILFEDLEDLTTPTDTITTWRAGDSFVYQEGEVIDTVYYDYTEILYKEELPYYGDPFEILDRYEIGRFITAYGIGLSL